MNGEFDKDTQEFNVYGTEAREELTANDEIDADEEGFMQGYESDANAAYCDNCKKVLEKAHLEKEIDSDIYTFCSDECVEEFERKRKSG
ncbi:hypothetical protein HON86_01685 [Candidatus Woesearchaeota archaeon]|jgi:hypothetical protein|nr:hypothetical protein [Candidatus Woesearchaeota archaeon]MBT4835312.1 hypothetical protein [Candidatus Woesearchaeota archaeon]MBT6734772.1 hypothetical protein [Candidatus Woesearchaeota archaeon]MBT7169559.1 hypothetical protein [Candidatus Woesearchaeota archaeon]MBT7474361.1 hypothetical protein [Candidatus Woesearchaeota archaeon]